MATLVVPGTLAGRLQIPANTLKRYLDLLELLYMVHRIVGPVQSGWLGNEVRAEFEDGIDEPVGGSVDLALR